VKNYAENLTNAGLFLSHVLLNLGSLVNSLVFIPNSLFSTPAQSNPKL